MRVAYLDSSVVVAIALEEPGSDRLRELVSDFDLIRATTLLEAEVMAALTRMGVAANVSIFDDIDWVIPIFRLSRDIERVLAAGYLKGGDCLHLASALFGAGDPSQVTFLTLDEKQRTVAARLGFRT